MFNLDMFDFMTATPHLLSSCTLLSVKNAQGRVLDRQSNFDGDSVLGVVYHVHFIYAFESRAYDGL